MVARRTRRRRKEGQKEKERVLKERFLSRNKVKGKVKKERDQKGEERLRYLRNRRLPFFLSSFSLSLAMR